MFLTHLVTRTRYASRPLCRISFQCEHCGFVSTREGADWRILWLFLFGPGHTHHCCPPEMR